MFSKLFLDSIYLFVILTQFKFSGGLEDMFNQRIRGKRIRNQQDVNAVSDSNKFGSNSEFMLSSDNKLEETNSRHKRIPSYSKTVVSSNTDGDQIYCNQYFPSDPQYYRAEQIARDLAEILYQDPVHEELQETNVPDENDENTIATGQHNLICIGGKSHEVRRLCKLHYRRYKTKKRVRTKCETCNMFLCSECHMVRHKLDVVPSILMPYSYQGNEEYQEVGEVSSNINNFNILESSQNEKSKEGTTSSRNKKGTTSSRNECFGLDKGLIDLLKNPNLINEQLETNNAEQYGKNNQFFTPENNSIQNPEGDRAPDEDLQHVYDSPTQTIPAHILDILPPGPHNFINIVGRVSDIRQNCKTHFKRYQLCKKVTTKCDSCDAFLCADCHKEEHQLECVPTLTALNAEQTCAFCNQVLGDDAEDLVEHTGTCTFIPHEMRNGRMLSYACYKPYEECNHQTNDRRDMRKHIRTHTKERPFRCECGKQYTDKSNLRKHIKKKHTNIKSKCKTISR